MKALKITGIVAGAILGLAVLVVLAVFILLHQSPAIVSRMEPVVSTPEAAQAFDTKWTSFNDAVKAAEAGTPVTMNLSQEEVTSKINQELQNVDLPEGVSLGNVTVNLQDGKILVSADVQYSALQGVAGVEIGVDTINGTPSIAVGDIDMGKLPVPEALKDQLTGLIPDGGVIDIGDLPVDITGIQIVDGQLVMDGVTR